MFHRPKPPADKPPRLRIVCTVVRPGDAGHRNQDTHPELVTGVPIDLPEIVLVDQAIGDPVPAELHEGDSHNAKVIYCHSQTGAWISRARIVGTVDAREYAHSRAVRIYNRFPAAVRANRRVKVVEVTR